MKHPHIILYAVFIAASTAIFGEQSLFAQPETSDCDLKNISVSLPPTNKTIQELLQEIAKQTPYTIQVNDKNDKKTLNKVKSIALFQESLNQTLRRLFKDINYSIICNEKQKILTVVLLDEKSLTTDALSAAPGEPVSFNLEQLDELPEALVQTPPQESVPEATTYEGVEDLAQLPEVFGNYDSTNFKLTNPDEKVDFNLNSLAEAEEALEKAGGSAGDNQNNATGEQASAMVREEDELAELSELSKVFSNEDSNNFRLSNPESQDMDFNLDDLAKADEEYQKEQEKTNTP